MQLSALDFEHLVREWQCLVGGKVQKVYLKERLHALLFYNKAHYTLLATDGVGFLTSHKLAWPKTPSGYCLFLRRRLANARITAVRQLGWDRVVAIDFDTREGPTTLVFEFLGELNSIYTQNNTIVSCLATHSYADRVVRGGVQYTPPPAQTDPREVSADALLNKPAAKTLAVEWSLGGKWAEELCAASNIDRAESLTAEHIKQLTQTMEHFRTRAAEAVHDETEALPFIFATKPHITERSDTYNHAIEHVLRGQFAQETERDNTRVERDQRTKQERIIRAQQAQLEKLEAESVKQQRSGELLYEHYAPLQELLANLKSDWKQLSLAQIREKYGSHPLVRQINEDGTIEVELGE
jgi:predicted ribosome quality control (RQC) complex YloA/Tae2 family protein